jgi:hypothetical protein
LECRTPLVVPPLIEPAGHRPLQAVDIGFQSRVPDDLPPPPQPVLQVYFILKGATGYLRQASNWTASLQTRYKSQLVDELAQLQQDKTCKFTYNVKLQLINPPDLVLSKAISTCIQYYYSKLYMKHPCWCINHKNLKIYLNNQHTFTHMNDSLSGD